MSEIKKMMVDGIARMLKNIGGNPARVIGTRTNVVSLKTPPLLTDIIVKKGTPIDENFVKQAEDAFAALVGNKNASDEQIETLYDNLEFAQNMKNPKIYIADQDMNNLMRDVYYEFENAKSSIMNNDLDDARGILRYEIEENYKYPKPVRDAAADARYMITRGEGISDWEKMGYDSEKEAIDDLLNKIQEGQNKTSKDNWPDYSDPIEGQPKQIEYYDFYTDLPEDTRNPDADFIDIKNMFGEFAKGGRVQAAGGGIMATREAFKSKAMSMKAMIDWLVDKSKTKFSRQLLDRVAKQDNGPQLITDLFAQEIQKTKGATTTVGKAPKTDVKKVRAQKQKTDDIEKDLAKSGQIPVKDQTDLQKDLKKITDLEISKSYKQALEGNDLDLSDDKYDAQILADYVANNRYRTDFYDLPQDVQLDLYDKSYQWLMNDKMEKAQRYKNIKIFDDAEASAMTKFMQEQDPEGFKNIERIVDDINTKNNTDAVDLEEFDVTDRKPNAKGGLNYLMGF